MRTLVNPNDPFARMFAIKFAPIEMVVKMAETEEDENVIEVIVQRLNEEKESDIVEESYAKLANAKCWKIRGFVAENAPIETVVKMAETEGVVYVVILIVQRLNEEKESDIVKENYARFANSKSWLIREFVVENAPTKIVVKMAETEENEDVAYLIGQRLNGEKESYIVKESYAKLANSKSLKIREFVVENAPTKIVVKMAETEEYRSIAKLIVQRLNEKKKSDIVKESYAKFANAKCWKIREFAVENATIEMVVKMAETEEDEDVAELILQRLNKEKDSDIVIESYAKLANAKSWKIRGFVSRNAPIEIVVKMTETEEEEYVTRLIVQRLTKDIDMIYEEINKNTNKVGKAYMDSIYIVLSKSEKIEHRLFVSKNASKSILMDMLKSETNEEVILEMLKRI